MTHERQPAVTCVPTHARALLHVRVNSANEGGRR
jgi:hypothetical protein